MSVLARAAPFGIRCTARERSEQDAARTHKARTHAGKWHDPRECCRKRYISSLMLSLKHGRRQAIEKFLETANNRSGVKWQSIDADRRIFYAMMTRRAIIWPPLLYVPMALFAQKPGATFKATSQLVQVSVSVTRTGNGAIRFASCSSLKAPALK